MLIALPPDTLTPAFAERLAALARAAPRALLPRRHPPASRRRAPPPRCSSTSSAGAPARRSSPSTTCYYHAPERRPLADVVTCIREKCTIHEAGLRLAANAERHLKPPEEMARLFASFPEAIARTVEIADACRFSLDELKYEYPDEPVPPGKTAQQHLTDLAWEGARKRYPRDLHPEGIPAEVQKRLVEELAIIAKLDYARYFLTVHDVVAFARNLEEPILCQGRGSAANSAVCYCLGITEVNPNESKLLFARFISENRNEPPDIDVDFEHERREEVIQYIYRRYGKDRAAICATVIHYRSRRAIREVGKAMGLTEDVTAALAKTVWGSHDDGLPDKHIREAGLDPANPAIRQAVGAGPAAPRLPAPSLPACRRLRAHARAARRDRARSAMPPWTNRTFIEWDKDDIDTLGLMKVDVLALGMLSCLKRGLDLLKVHYGKDYTLATLPKEDPAVYDMLCQANSVGVFQVEVPRADVDAAAARSRASSTTSSSRWRSCGRARSRATWCIPICAGAMASTRSTTPRPIPRTGPPTSCATCWSGPRACRCSRSRRCRSPSRPPSSRPTRPTACAAPWPPSATTAPCISSARSSSTA